MKTSFHPLKLRSRVLTLGISAAALVSGLATAEEKTTGVATEEKPKDAKVKKQSAFPTLDILPEGSILRRIRLPRYDKDFTPTSLFTAEKLTVIGQAHIEAEDVSINRYAKNGKVVMSTKMRHAIYNQANSTLHAKQAIYIKGKTSKGLTYLASGTGLIYNMENQHGFLNGPATTVFQLPPSDSSEDTPKKATAMQLKRPHLSPSIASIAGTLITLSTSLMAEPPAQLTPTELTEMDKLAVPMSQQIKLDQAVITSTLEADTKLSSDADDAMVPFLKEINKGALLVQTTHSPESTKPKTEAEVATEEAKKKVETILKVECDGGLYFDSDTGVLAYLKNIRLTEPRFTLSCSHELKVFLEQKPKEPTPSDTAKVNEAKPDTKADETDKAIGKSLSSFGGLKRIIATGKVKVIQKDDAGKTFIATAETASYDGQTGEMILRGGRPRLQQSANQYLQAEAPGQYIRIQKNGKLVTSSGKWSMQMVTKKTTP